MRSLRAAPFGAMAALSVLAGLAAAATGDSFANSGVGGGAGSEFPGYAIAIIVVGIIAILAAVIIPVACCCACDACNAEGKPLRSTYPSVTRANPLSTHTDSGGSSNYAASSYGNDSVPDAYRTSSFFVLVDAERAAARSNAAAPVSESVRIDASQGMRQSGDDRYSDAESREPPSITPEGSPSLPPTRPMSTREREQLRRLSHRQTADPDFGVFVAES